MNLTELKQKPITELLELAEQMGIENMARSRKQDVIFSLLKKHAKSGEEISGDGVLEILQDGGAYPKFGPFLPSLTILMAPGASLGRWSGHGNRGRLQDHHPPLEDRPGRPRRHDRHRPRRHDLPNQGRSSGINPWSPGVRRTLHKFEL